MNRTRIIGAMAAAALTGGVLVAAPAEAVEEVDVRPERRISSTSNSPRAVHLATSGRTYVAEFHRDRVVVYGAKARGAARPLYRIAGSRTGIFEPHGIARDSGGRIYVANGNKRVLVFGKNARGNARPIRVLHTGVFIGSGISIRGERLMVSGSAAIKLYRRTASGNAAPVRQIAGDQAQLGGLLDADINADGRIWAVFGEGEFATVFAPGASGNVAPERTITQNNQPGLWEPEAVAFDRAGRAYLGEHWGAVRVFAPDASGDATPRFMLSNGWQRSLDGLSVSRTGKLALVTWNRINVYPRLLATTRPWAVRAASVSGPANAARRVVRWKAPAADGGTALNRYRIVVKRGDRVVRVVRLKAGRRSYALTRRSLPAGTLTVRVQARNRKGYGPAASVPITVVK